MKKYVIIAMLISLWFSTVPTTTAQTADAVAENTPRFSFTLERNCVIVPVRVNGSRPLKLILDTGMGFDGVYLFHKELTDEIDMTDAIEVRVPGAGAGEASTATMIETGTLTFGNVTVDNQRIIIAHSEQTQGFPSDGVIGWNLFGHYTVEIDYDNERITLHDTTSFQADSTWYSLPIILKENRPFLEGRVEVVPGEIVGVSVYIDLASGEALEMLVTKNQKYTLPENLDSSYLGTGLSGNIYGHRGRSRRLWLGKYELTDITTAFAPGAVRSKQEGADGVLGNDCIRRFNVVFDYTHGMLHLRPSKYFDTAFE